MVDGTGAPGRPADIAVSDGVITAVGDVDGPARRIGRRRRRAGDAGFVDIHTHFDGQVCWDKQVTPSSWHGVTTVVMGNCGVGFAPVVRAPSRAGRADGGGRGHPRHGAARGHPWGWESFGEYLDAIDTPYSVDIGAQLPHVALRYYVMGDRCYDDATADDIARMADLTPRRTGRRRARLLDLALLRPPQQAGPGRAGHPCQRRRDRRHRRGAARRRPRDDGDHLRPHGRARRAGWIEASPASSAVRSRCCPARRWTAASGSSPAAAAEGLRDPPAGRRPAGVGADDAGGHAQPAAPVPGYYGDQGPADRRAAGGAARPGVPRRVLADDARSTATPTPTLSCRRGTGCTCFPADLSYEPTTPTRSPASPRRRASTCARC